MPGPDDLAALRAEREAADRAYNEALTRLDRAVQRLPRDFPQPPPAPDEHQITPLNALWKIELAADSGGFRGRLASVVRRLMAPLVDQQRAFNAAVVDHLNRNVPVGRETRVSIESTLTVLRDTIAELISFQSVLVVYLQHITPYVDTKDRDVAGLLRGLSAAINSVADEVLRRSEAAATRDFRHDQRLDHIEAEINALRTRLDEAVRLASAPRASGT